MPHGESLVLKSVSLTAATGRHDVLVRDGRVSAIRPSRRETEHEARAGAIVEGGGRLLLPGFCDAHCHLVFAGLLELRADLGGATSRSEVLARIADAVTARSGETVIAEGWDETEWGDSGALTISDLDAIARDVPIVARRVCGHVAVVNGAALARVPDAAGVDRSSGTLREEPAMAVESHLPGSGQERSLALDRAVGRALSRGVTEVHEPCRLQDLLELREAASVGRLPVRVRAFLRYEEWSALGATRRSEILGRGEAVEVVGLKLFADGTFGARSAALRAPYAGGGTGTLLLDGAAVEGAARAAHAEGLALAIHAIGERGVEVVLDGLERAGSAGDRIEHAELIDERDVERAARMGVTASMQPNFVRRWGLAGGLYSRVLGETRARRTNRFASLRREGVALAFGSDSMPLDPLFGMGGALHHPDPAERLSPLEALEAYTRGGRASIGEEGGALDVGSRADLCLLSVDSPEALSEARVVATWIGGRTHFRLDGEP